MPAPSVLSTHPGLTYLEQLPLWDTKTAFGLETIAAILAALDNPQDKIRAIHVTGTNGKGTVCALLAAMLRAQGSNVGQFASPHLSHVTERCIINGRPCDPNNFGSALLCVKDVSEKLHITPSYFEVATAASFLEFYRLRLDWMVVEVGLGGRLDATNSIKKAVATIITGVNYDHMHFLGNTLAAIATEKAGIFRPNVPAFIGDISDEVYETLLSISSEMKTPIEFYSRDYFFDMSTLTVSCSQGTFQLNPGIALLKAKYQQKNAALAVRIAKYLGISDVAIDTGLRAARWPGRVEHFSVSPLPSNQKNISVLIDVAHNPEGIRALIDYLEDYLAKHRAEPHAKKTQLIFVVSILNTKDWRLMLTHLRDFAAKHTGQKSSDIQEGNHSTETTWVFTTSAHEQAVSPETLREFMKTGDVVNNATHALEKTFEIANTHSLVVITGSIYLVGMLRPLITSEPFKTMEEYL